MPGEDDWLEAAYEDQFVIDPDFEGDYDWEEEDEDDEP
jgi:hypothetical protein